MDNITSQIIDLLQKYGGTEISISDLEVSFCIELDGFPSISVSHKVPIDELIYSDNCNNAAPAKTRDELMGLWFYHYVKWLEAKLFGATCCVDGYSMSHQYMNWYHLRGYTDSGINEMIF